MEWAEVLRLIFLNPMKMTDHWHSENNWWIKHFNPTEGFQSIWKALLDKYDSKIAYFTSTHTFSYHDIELNANIYRQKFLGQKIVRINGHDEDWLTQAIAAWTQNQIIILYDPAWREVDKIRYQLTLTVPQDLESAKNPHLLLFTSGTTGNPKPIIRNTSFAIYEAASYIEDISPELFKESICLIKPWFGAITKHCLGMLFAGVAQHFNAPKSISYSKTLVYGTPSLISNHDFITNQQWKALSLTGETVNAFHVKLFKNCLDKTGFILNAYGSSECGVIARQKFYYNNLDKMYGKGFQGKVLPGKDIKFDNRGVLSVSTYQGSFISTGDLGHQSGDSLALLGRLSLKRKIQGQWYDASPLLHLLSKHLDIYHVELSPEPTIHEQLIINVAAKPSLKSDDLYYWIAERLIPIKLLPHINMVYHHPLIGITGKQKINNLPSCRTSESKNYISLITELIQSFLNQDKTSNLLLDKSLESLGFNSLDITQLILKLVKKGYKTLSANTILKTDTPRQIAKFLKQEDGLFRTFTQSNNPKKIQIICLGTGIMTARQKLLELGDIKYLDIINDQTSKFVLSEIAKLILDKESKFFNLNDPIYIMGFSINALLAIELAYQLEKNKKNINGIFLLDPPSQKRFNTLRNKKKWLNIRLSVLSHWIKKGRIKWQQRFLHEIRKFAIASQPIRDLNTSIITVFTKENYGENPWVVAKSKQQTIQLDFSGHLELVNRPDGVDSWIKHALKVVEN